MSQEMHYDEGGRERQRPTIDSYDAGYQAGTGYRDPFAGASGQKISMQYQQPSQVLSAGQRLALAIVSVVMLVPMTAIILGTSIAGSGGFLGLTGGLIALGLVCVTIMIINFVFNRH